MIFTMLLYALGKAVDIKEESYSVKFIKGYLVYSFFVAIGGMSVQLLHLKYRIFFAYMSVVLLLAVLKIIYSIKQENYIKIVTLKNFVKCNWFLIVLTIILCYMMFYYYRAFWYGNHLDDGYYLTKIATIASGCENNIDNIPVGVGKGLGITYLLNTWEIESAFYIKMLHVTPSLYIRLFQSGFNYYLFFNCVLAFGDRIARAVKKDYNKKALQYVCGTCLLFFVYYVYMQDTKLLFLRDTFTLNTAMYFGSSIVKMIAIMCLLMFYLEDEKITWKMVLGVFGISVVMISKSTIVLPTLFVTGVSYVIVTLLFTKEWKQKIIGIILAAFIVLAGIILPNNQVAQKEVYQYVKEMNEAGIAAACDGVPAENIYLAARKVIENTEYIPYFYQSIGHGFGLFVHEHPFVRPMGTDILKAGNTMTVEPGIYIPGWGGVRIEDDILITKTGNENLVSAPKDLIELF